MVVALTLLETQMPAEADVLPDIGHGRRPLDLVPVSEEKGYLDLWGVDGRQRSGSTSSNNSASSPLTLRTCS
jgi:hypothetical protein